MKNIRIFVFENFPFLEVKVSIYLNRRVFRNALSRVLGSRCLCHFAYTVKKELLQLDKLKEQYLPFNKVQSRNPSDLIPSAILKD